MKRLQTTTLTILILATFFLGHAQAGDKRVGGMIIGGGTGAIVGQTLGRNAQSTIIGATIGGVTGLLIGDHLERQQRHAYHPPRATVYRERYTHRGYDRGHRPIFRDDYRSYRDNCRKIVTVKKGHHRTERVVRTICDNNSRHQRGNRFHNRF